ncbi:hypothetical protein VTN77DRAFT_5784 [Rasamsonia byssochlamydoides]|uniref:uncharacterized protein n=1 Tax=Rasamsonia byssochlamydoides TaxID=89139 RepID=UPI003742EE10
MQDTSMFGPVQNLSMSLENHPSFRLACDRCHFHKLKCPRNKTLSNRGACERCIRAKVPCTFSLRAHTGRSPAGKTSTSTSAKTDRTAQRHRRQNNLNPPLTRHGRCAGSECFGEEEDDNMHGLPLPITGGDLNNQIPIDNASHSRWDQWANVHEQNTNSTVDFLGPLSYTEERFVEHAIEMPFPDFGAELRSWDVSEKVNLAPRGPNNFDRNMKSSIARYGKISLHKANASHCNERLSVLAANLHRHLEMIDGLRLQQVDNSGHFPLRNYQIGDLLQLSQVLTDVLQSISSRACFRSAPDMLQLQQAPEQIAEENEPIETSSDVNVDTPTALLILNCYVCLIRIYSVVFMQLHQYIRSLPDAQSARREFGGFQFDELPPLNEAHMRTHAAFRMLLESLGRNEEMLGLPTDFRCAKIRGDGTIGLQQDQIPTGNKSVSGHDEESATSTCTCGSVNASHIKPRSSATGLVSFELVEAVLRQEAWTSVDNDGGGLALLRKDMKGVRNSLRYKMGL